VSVDDPAIKKDKLEVESFAVTNSSNSVSSDVIDRLFGKRSSWMELKADVALILRFV